MEELLNWMEYIKDVRQERKVRHKLKDILSIVLFATLINANDWVEMALFAKEYQDYLRKYIELKNGIPSHDTLNRVMGLVSPEILQQLYGKWQKLLDEIRVKGRIITIDAMGTQKSIAEKIRKKREDYVLALKGNQADLYEDVELYFRDKKIRKELQEKKNYVCTIEKAHGQLEKREYYQTEDIGWLPQKKEWKGLKSIGMEEKNNKGRKRGRERVPVLYQQP